MTSLQPSLAKRSAKPGQAFRQASTSLQPSLGNPPVKLRAKLKVEHKVKQLLAKLVTKRINWLMIKLKTFPRFGCTFYTQVSSQKPHCTGNTGVKE